MVSINAGLENPGANVVESSLEDSIVLLQDRYIVNEAKVGKDHVRSHRDARNLCQRMFCGLVDDVA